MDDKGYLLLIDGSSLLTTQFFGNLPREIMFAKTDEEKAKYFYKIMQTSKGIYTNAIFGFMRTLLKVVREQRPSYLAVAWDMSRDTFRREIYADYKGNRSDTLPPLGEQFGLCQQVLDRIGVRQFMADRYEADDFCGTLSAMFENEVPVRIITKDNDYLQLVSPQTNLWMMHASADKTEELYKKYSLTHGPEIPERCFQFTPELVQKEFGILPESVPDLKGLQGDSSDNIKGVPGVGPATAVALIAKYRTIEALYAAMEGLDDKELKALAQSWKEIGVSRSPVNNLLKTGEELVGREAAFLSKKLATIKRDIELPGLSLSDLALHIDSAELSRIFDELEIKTLKPDTGEAACEKTELKYGVTSDFDEVMELGRRMCSEDHIGVSFACDGDILFGAAVAFPQKETVYIPCEGFISPEIVTGLLRAADEAGTACAVYDLKPSLKAMEGYRPKNAFDECIACYLISPEAGSYPLSSLPEGRRAQLTERSERFGKQSLSEVFLNNGEELAHQCALESRVICGAYTGLEASLKDMEMIDLFRNIEMPLIFVLDDMEKAGVLVNRDELASFSARLGQDINTLEKEIYRLTGEEFNINSPKQLGVILFEKLKLPHGKKTKSGYSTSADVLDKLKGEDPVIGLILEYRKLAKLKSTYADGLNDYIDPDGRIRTTFNQTVTATGRLSSTEPNLQNIPIRTELGMLIRKAFIPKEGCCFVDADYSQIELRILASMSGDEKLISAYRNSEDIHRATAAAVFKVPVSEVTPTLRSRAKAVNFGIVYGISSFGLSDGLDISIKEAEKYIADYFETYPDIKRYLDGLVSEAKDKGYSTTLFGRRRNIPELLSANFMQRQFGERIAMNTPIQGTAADIIKIAMIRVNDRLRREVPDSRLVLQIHDELLVEAREEDKAKVKAILEEEMHNAADLKVSLDVSANSGYDWTEAH